MAIRHVQAPGFNVTSFDALGFNGSISGAAQSYFPPTGVTLAGLDSTPGIIASNNGFFPGNPLGEAVFGTWVVTPIPEPNPLLWVFTPEPPNTRAGRIWRLVRSAALPNAGND